MIMSSEPGAVAKQPTFSDTYVTVNSLRLHCVTTGRGQLMLFLHGFPEFWYEWKDQLREFGKDHLAVAPDLRGYNLSDKPSGVENYHLAALLEDIRGLADHFRHGRKIVLVAHDWGGGLAWAFAIAHPEYVEKLIIINAPHPAIFSRLLVNDPDQQKASQYMFLFRSSKAEETLSANNYAILVGAVLGGLLKTGAFTDADKDAYIKAWSQPGALTGGLNYYRAAQLGPPASPDVAKEIGASNTNFSPDQSKTMVRVPTLVIWGEKDEALIARNLDGLNEFVPNLTIKRIPDASHWVVHEKPDQVNGYIRQFIQ